MCVQHGILFENLSLLHLVLQVLNNPRFILIAPYAKNFLFPHKPNKLYIT